jgi:hypothetical protein
LDYLAGELARRFSCNWRLIGEQARRLNKTGRTCYSLGMADEPLTTPSRKRRRWLRVVLVAVVALFVGLWLALSSKPAYWQPIDGHDTQVVETAEQFERNMTSQITAVRDEQPWQLEVTQKQLNEWLAARLPQWLASQKVDAQIVRQISRTMVSIDPAGVEIAAEIGGSFGGVMRARYKPTLGANHRVVLVLQDVHAGMIPVPFESLFGSVVQPYVAEKQQEQLEKIRRKIESLELNLPLGDKRKVEVIGAELHPGKMLLTCRTYR